MALYQPRTVHGFLHLYLLSFVLMFILLEPIYRINWSWILVFRFFNIITHIKKLSMSAKRKGPSTLFVVSEESTKRVRASFGTAYAGWNQSCVASDSAPCICFLQYGKFRDLAFMALKFLFPFGEIDLSLLVMSTFWGVMHVHSPQNEWCVNSVLEKNLNSEYTPTIFFVNKRKRPGAFSFLCVLVRNTTNTTRSSFGLLAILSLITPVAIKHSDS